MKTGKKKNAQRPTSNVERSTGEALKPCPFCGVAPGGVVTMSRGEKTVGCYCGAQGPVADMDADAAECWNQRIAAQEGGTE